MSLRRKLYLAGMALIIVLLVMPSLTPEWAVRKKLMLRHPITAVTTPVVKGTIHDPSYGQLYHATDAELSFVYVKHGRWGYYVASAGTGP